MDWSINKLKIFSTQGNGKTLYHDLQNQFDKWLANMDENGYEVDIISSDTEMSGFNGGSSGCAIITVLYTESKFEQ